MANEIMIFGIKIQIHKGSNIYSRDILPIIPELSTISPEKKRHKKIR